MGLWGESFPFSLGKCLQQCGSEFILGRLANMRLTNALQLAPHAIASKYILLFVSCRQHLVCFDHEQALPGQRVHLIVNISKYTVNITIIKCL